MEKSAVATNWGTRCWFALLRHGWVIKDCVITAMLWTSGGFKSCLTIHNEYISIKNIRQERINFKFNTFFKLNT
jgi:hypothetical protein